MSSTAPKATTPAKGQTMITSNAAAPAPTPEHVVPSDTYKSGALARADRAALQRLANRLRVPEPWLRPDDCGCWHIAGPAGHVYAHSDKRGWLGGYLIVCHPGDGRTWTAAKRALGGKVQQDGDDEGVILLDQTAVHVPALRKAIGCAR